MKAILLTLVLAAFANATNAFLMTCREGEKTYRRQSVWDIHTTTESIAYFDTYLFDLKFDCTFEYGNKEVKPVRSNLGIVAFPPQRKSNPTKIAREKPYNHELMETSIGFPVYRPIDLKYATGNNIIFANSGNGVIMLNVSATHFVTAEYAINALKFPTAIKENAVNVCGEGWIYYGNAARQSVSNDCIPRGNKIKSERLYSIATNADGAQMLLYYGAKNNHKNAIKGWVLINEYGEFIDFAK